MGPTISGDRWAATRLFPAVRAMPSDVERSSEIKTLALFDTHEAGRTLPARTHVPWASGSAIYQVMLSPRKIYHSTAQITSLPVSIENLVRWTPTVPTLKVGPTINPGRGNIIVVFRLKKRGYKKCITVKNWSDRLARLPVGALHPHAYGSIAIRGNWKKLFPYCGEADPTLSPLTRVPLPKRVRANHVFLATLRNLGLGPTVWFDRIEIMKLDNMDSTGMIIEWNGIESTN